MSCCGWFRCGTSGAAQEFSRFLLFDSVVKNLKALQLLWSSIRQSLSYIRPSSWQRSQLSYFQVITQHPNRETVLLLTDMKYKMAEPHPHLEVLYWVLYFNNKNVPFKKKKKGIYTVSVKLWRILRFFWCSLPSLNSIYKWSGQNQGLFCRSWIRSLILGAQQLHHVTFLDKKWIYSRLSRTQRSSTFHHETELHKLCGFKPSERQAVHICFLILSHLKISVIFPSITMIYIFKHWSLRRRAYSHLVGIPLKWTY